MYHYAIHDKFFEARDLLLMTHLPEKIHKAKPSLQVLFNRATVQLGMAEVFNFLTCKVWLPSDVAESKTLTTAYKRSALAAESRSCWPKVSTLATKEKKPKSKKRANKDAKYHTICTLTWIWSSLCISFAPCSSRYLTWPNLVTENNAERYCTHHNGV